MQKKHFLNLFTVCILLFFSACKTEINVEQKQSYFDLTQYFQDEIVSLEKNVVAIDKIITKGNNSENKKIDNIDWEDELNLFVASDINKGAWREAYKVDSVINGEELKVTYQIKENQDIAVKKIALYFESNNCVVVKILREEQNPLFISKQELTYEKGIGYEINGFQKIIGVFESNFFVNAQFLYQ